MGQFNQNMPSAEEVLREYYDKMLALEMKLKKDLE